MGLTFRLTLDNGKYHMNRTCQICDHSAEESQFKKYETDCSFVNIPGIDQHLVRYQCPNCDVIFGTDQMINLSVEELKKAYQIVYLSGVVENDSSVFQFDTFMMCNPKTDGMYLDWGAGETRFSEKVKLAGYTIYNYDPFVDSIYTKNYVSHDFVINNKFDIIFSTSLIEHLQHPIEDLKYMASLLKPGGYMVHSTDCYAYCCERTKYHLFFFVGRSLDALDKKTGLKHSFITDLRCKFSTP